MELRVLKFHVSFEVRVVLALFDEKSDGSCEDVFGCE
jgi:hypothetical protein